MMHSVFVVPLRVWNSLRWSPHTCVACLSMLPMIISHLSAGVRQTEIEHWWMQLLQRGQMFVSVEMNSSHFIHFKTVATEVEIHFLSTLFICCHSLEVPFSLLKNGVSQYFCPYNECTSHWCLGIRLWLTVCIMQIMTWLSADQSSSSTLTESSFIVDPCLIHRDTVMLE